MVLRQVDNYMRGAQRSRSHPVFYFAKICGWQEIWRNFYYYSFRLIFRIAFYEEGEKIKRQENQETFLILHPPFSNRWCLPYVNWLSGLSFSFLCVRHIAATYVCELKRLCICLNGIGPIKIRNWEWPRIATLKTALSTTSLGKLSLLF